MYEFILLWSVFKKVSEKKELHSTNTNQNARRMKNIVQNRYEI